MARIYDPNRDAFVDVKTLEPRPAMPGEVLLAEWLGNIDMRGFYITRKTLRELYAADESV